MLFNAIRLDIDLLMLHQIYEAELDAEKNLTNHAERKDFICRKYSDLTFTSSKYHDIILESSK